MTTTDLGLNTHTVQHITTDYNSAPKILGNALPLECIFSEGTMILTLYYFDYNENR